MKENYSSRLTIILKIAAILLILLFSLSYRVEPVKADVFASGTCGNNLTWTLDDEGVLTIIGSGAISSYNSAADVPWNEYQDKIKTVYVDDGVTSIGKYVFSECGNLTSITLPDGLTSIGDCVFCNCSSLTDIELPDSLTSIGNSAFEDCRSLTSITIPEGVTNMGLAVFFGCSGLISVSIPDSFTTIRSDTFRKCSSLTSITFPDGLTSIKNRAFAGCSNLTEIILPEGFTSIGNDVFNGCTNLTNVTIPDSLSQLGNGAFEGCQSLTNIALPDGLNSIEGFTFAGCWSLNSIKLPGGLVSIGKRAFFCCKSLTSIILPSSLSSLEEDVFYGCSSLTDIILPNNLTSIGRYTFYRCSSLTDIILPNSITDIGQCAFAYCINLRTVSLPEQLSTIGKQCFDMCSSLISISIPQTTEEIQDSAFRKCINLEDIYYAGTEEQWESLSRIAGFGEVNLFANCEQDAELDVTIMVTDVSGGKTVTMEAPEGSIYYTLDGSTPCSASLPYQEEFLIDTAGNYTIKAIVFNLEDNTVGDITSQNVSIEQSDVPQIEAVGNHIYILPSENVLYSLDLSEEPDILYRAPLEWDGNLFVKAQTVEMGKAKSKIVGGYFQKTQSSFVYREDSFSFNNEEQSFGYPLGSYSIPETQMVNLFGFHAARLLLDDMTNAGVSIGAWGGSCFGMCVTSLMFIRGNLSLANYTETPTSVYSLPAPGSPDSMLTRLIERYQLSQFAHAVDNEKNDHLINRNNNKNDIENLLETLDKVFTGEDPDAIVLILYGSSNNLHAVVPYRLEQDDDGNSRIYIYDPDFPDQPEGENVVRIEKEGTTKYNFEYQNPGYVKYDRGISYNRLSTVLDKIDQVRSYNENGILYGVQQEKSLLLSLNTVYFQILDETGNEISDYTLYTMNNLLTGRTILSLPEGTYTIKNLDVSKEQLSIGVADSREYYRAEIGNASAIVKIGFQYGHLSMEISNENNTEMVFYIYDENGEMNTISADAKYIRIYAALDQTILVDSSEATVLVNGKPVTLEGQLEDNDMHMGAVIKRTKEKAPETYTQETVTMSAAIDQILEQTYSLTVEVRNAGENAVIYAACYDEQGQMISVKSADIREGETDYPFTIDNNPSMVKVFLIDKTGSRPILEPIIIR